MGTVENKEQIGVNILSIKITNIRILIVLETFTVSEFIKTLW